MRYSQGFRNSVLRKVLPPENRSVYSVAKECGISQMTLHNWLKKYKSGTIEKNGQDGEPSPEQRDVHEKYRLLLESKALSDDDLGEWLRRHGLHEEHLLLWEQELEDVMTDKQQSLKKENTELKKKIKQLEREARRNEKAMAEALALIALKKKVDNYFQEDEED